MQVITKYGPGEVVDRESVRGKTSLRVAGVGFNVWLDPKDVFQRTAEFENDEAASDDDIDESNSTTLPYNPEPQHEELFTVEQTLQPGEYEVDADERLHPSDSLTFERRSEPSGPQPDSDLFAKGAMAHYANPAAAAIPALLKGAPAVAEGAAGAAGGAGKAMSAAEVAQQFMSLGQPGGGDSGLVNKAIDESPLGGIIDPLKRMTGSIDPGPKYAKVIHAVDHFNDPVQRFRDDPIGEIGRHASVHHSGGVDQATEEWGRLVEADTQIREAAWADVRNKAKRLRAEGKVHVKDIGPGRIAAVVDGDNGSYDVLIYRGPGFGGIGKGASSVAGSCSCKWGSWQYKRKYTFVGRLCSHQLAALNELQSHDSGSRNERGQFSRSASAVSDFKTWSKDVGTGPDYDAVADFISLNPDLSDGEVEDLYEYVDENPMVREERDYSTPGENDWPDMLHSGPGRNTPDLVWPEYEDYTGTVDVTEDERETTGPGQILHFSSRTAAPDADRYRTPGLADTADAYSNTISPPKAAPTTYDNMTPQQLTQFGVDSANQMNSMPGAPSTGRPSSEMGNTGATPGKPNANDAAVNSARENAPAASNPMNFGLDQPGAAPAPGGGGGDNKGGLGDFSALDLGGSPTAGTPASPTASPSTPGDATIGAGGTTPIDSAIGQGEYQIQSGDTLGDIAQRSGYGDNYQALADANNISDPDTIYAGDTINIGDPSGGAAAGDAAGTGLADNGPTAASDAMGGAVASDPGAALTGPALTDPGLTGPAPEKVSARLFYADEDFEDPAEPGVAQGNLATDPAEPGVAGNTTSTDDEQQQGGAGFDPSTLMEFGAPLMSGATSLMAPITQGIGNAIGTGLSSIFSSRRHASARTADLLERLRELSREDSREFDGRHAEHNDAIAEVVDELRERGYDASQMVAAVTRQAETEGFQGSGPNPKNWWTTSKEYVDDFERPRHVDVTALGDDDMIKYSDSAGQKSASANADNSDVVRQFHAHAAQYGSALDSRPMRRTAGRTFTLAEQRELEDESHPLGARNTPTHDDLRGTHYVD